MKDLQEYRAYNQALQEVHHWLKLRSSIGETAAPEDVITAADAHDSIGECNAKIAAAIEEARKHETGARRWAAGGCSFEPINANWLKRTTPEPETENSYIAFREWVRGGRA